LSRPAFRHPNFRHISVFLVAIAFAGAAGAADAQNPAQATRRPDGSREWPVDLWLARFSPAGDAAWRQSQTVGSAFADSLLRVARASGDRSLATAAHAWRGRKHANDYQLPKGEADLDTAWALASALRDSAGLCRVLWARAHGVLVRGDYDAAKAQYLKLLPMAKASGLPDVEGASHRALGFLAKEEGRYDAARRELRAAIRLIPADRFENRHSRFLLAEVENRTGHHDAARDTFLVILDEARRRKDRWLEAAVFNDLGNLEYEGGDMATADRYWEYAANVFDSTGNASSALSSRTNRAQALRQLGRIDEARALLDRLLRDCDAIDFAPARDGLYAEMAGVYRGIGRYGEAERLYRAVRAAAVDDAMEEEAATIELAGLLCTTGRAAEAEALMDSLLAPERRARMSRAYLCAAWSARSAARRAQGRAKAAIAEARAAEWNARADREVNIYYFETALELARCHRALGAPDSAVVVLRRATSTWEKWRASISDLEWRERQGSGLAGLFAEYGLSLLDSRRRAPESRRIGEAFDALQTFQARTLEERMQGRGLAGAGMRRRVTADSLRRGVLSDGELLVDLVATPDTTFAFLVSRGSIGVQMLPGTVRLERLHSAWREATLSGANDAVVRSGLRRLSDEVLSPMAAWVAASQRVIVSGGGPLSLWPLTALTLPGESGPLGDAREISTVPSATLLAALRGRAGARATPGLLALGRTTDAKGRNLPGAERELRTLGAEYTPVEVRANRGERPVPELVGDLSRWDLLHFAAHAEAVAGSPWRSGFLLGRGAGDDAYLRASTVAGMSLRARLAVLSGCQSAGATTLAGEGALGLANAFLCSGASSVVATLWPIEDRVAEKFMDEFYAALARGRTVAGAVGDAQRGLRGNSETAQVRDWAAFVASGSGGTRVQLTPRLTPGGKDRPTR
jgi:CHAT domain-containing protein/tetratricopeptide (TPR) repeat protein